MEPLPPNNGTPIIPTWVSPVASAVGAVALAVTQITPPHTVAFKVATMLLGLCGVFGPVSAGWRK